VGKTAGQQVVIFETERLLAREMSRADLDFIANLLGDAEVMRFYPRRYSRAQAEGWIERQLQRYGDDGHGLWLIQRRDTGEPVGQVGLLLQRVDRQPEPEIGYLIHRPFWRCGYATEAGLATRQHAFDVLGYQRVISLIRPENGPSQGVARKLGMERERLTIFADLEHWVFAVSRAPA
jgi:[ribosomal protein S5]-alanine N-acetyltransferase